MAIDRMGITKITIENFKGISEQVTIPLKPITLLFGANSAGKSTVVQALHYAREVLERHNPDPDITLAGADNLDLGGFESLIHKQDLERKMRIGFELAVGDDGLFLDKELDEQNKDINSFLEIQTVGVEITTAWENDPDIRQAWIEH